LLAIANNSGAPLLREKRQGIARSGSYFQIICHRRGGMRPARLRTPACRHGLSRLFHFNLPICIPGARARAFENPRPPR